MQILLDRGTNTNHNREQRIISGAFFTSSNAIYNFKNTTQERVMRVT